MLRQAVVGRRIQVSWTYGDYAPGNVRVGRARGPVTGIVDWGGARPGQPALIDEYPMVLTTSYQTERADLGTLVAERLRAGGLSGRERIGLCVARERADSDSGDRERHPDKGDS
jgi:Phosphotransferase enzyme family